MPGLTLGIGLGIGGGRPLSALAQAILQTYGGTLFAPSTDTCFEDSAGSTRAILDGLVGCIVDSATEEGPELVTNGDGTTLTGWTLSQTGGPITTDAGEFHLVSDGNYTAMTQSILTAGRIYKVEFDYRIISGSGKFSLGGVPESVFSGTGHKTYYGIASGASFYLARATGLSSEFYIDNISVREVGLIAIQSTTGNKPRLRKGTVTAGVSDGIGPWWLDFDGVDDALAVKGLDAGYADSTIITANYGVVQTTAQSQDISAGLSFTADNAGKIIVPADNALAAGELATLQAYANTLGGYTP